MIFAPRVGHDLRDIGDWIAQENPDRAVTFIEDILARCLKLTEFPNIHSTFPTLGPNVRRCNHGAYAIFYEVDADVVAVLAIVHGARDLDLLNIR